MKMLRSDLADIYACGWRLRTGLPLPGTLPWIDPARGDPDVIFVAGPVPAELVEPVVDRSVLQIAADGTALARFEGIGRFLLRDERVVCDLAVPLEAPEITPVVFGNILACVCWRRRQLALHGSAVAIDGSAVMMLGRVATGKSLLAAALVRRGHCVLTDEVAAASDGKCFPAGAPLQLADDALRAAGLDPTGLPYYENFPIPKRHWIAGPAPEPRPYTIAAVICLSKAEPDERLDPQPLIGDGAVEAILNHAYWRDMLNVLDSRVVAEREAMTLTAMAPVYRFPVPRALERVTEVAARIDQLVRGGG